MAATHDSGRVVVLPYNQLVAINFTRKMSDADVEAIFGKNSHTFAADVTLSTGPEEKEVPEEVPQEPAAEPVPAAPSAPATPAAKPAKGALPTRAELLAKLRARLNESAKPG